MASTTSTLSVDHECERAVRFDDQCVLIPELYRPRKGILHLNARPRLASKSFTLPAWPMSSSTSQERLAKEEEKDRGRKLTIALPSFGQARSSSSTQIKPMPPCLRSPDREHPSRQPRRSSSFPHSHHARRPRSISMPVATQPLRGCCEACIPAVEAFLASPTLPEHMTKGAKRLQRSASQTKSGSDSMVMVDEMDMIRNDIHKVSIAGIVDERQEEISPTEIMQPEPSPALGVCLYDDADECELFPLPSPSPRSSPRHSPFTSPSGSQTNLATPSTPSPVIRGSSPLSVCCSANKDREETIKGILKEKLPRTSNTPLSAPKSTNPPTNPKPRRPSLSGLGTSISKGGLAVVKGFSGLGGGSASIAA